MHSRSRPSAFTLVELIASAAVITLLMLMLVQMSKSTADTWKKGLTRAEQFRESRRAFETVTRRLSTATLNTYWDYKYAATATSTDAPIGYQRQSELRFRVLSMETLARETGYHPTYGVFFQSPSATTDPDEAYWKSAYASATDRAPVSRLDGMLNSWGYFLQVSDTAADMPDFLSKNAPPHYRSRLMEFREDTNMLSVYKLANNLVKDDWFSKPIVQPGNTHVIAENIIALIFLPRLSSVDEAARKANASVGTTYQLLSPNFDYDSKRPNNYGLASLNSAVLPNQINPFNQLPPVVEVAMVALDENSANKLALGASDKKQLDLVQVMAGLFQTADFLESRPGDAPGDLSTLEDRLRKRGLSYRLFVSNVSIRGARWSASQSD